MTTAIVSGATGGIGQEVTRQLLALGYEVFGLGRNHDKLEQHANYRPIQIDFANIASIESTIKNQITTPPNLLICCAGYGEFKYCEQFSTKQMQQVMNVNFLSQAILIKTVLPDIKINSGKIIMVASESALNGYKHGTMYCASKYALRGFCQSLRLESSKSGVAVSIVNPGVVSTNFFDPLDFEPGKDPNNAITAEQVAEIILSIVKIPNNCVVEELNCQPLKKVIAWKES